MLRIYQDDSRLKLGAYCEFLGQKRKIRCSVQSVVREVRCLLLLLRSQTLKKICRSFEDRSREWTSQIAISAFLFSYRMTDLSDISKSLLFLHLSALLNHL